MSAASKRRLKDLNRESAEVRAETANWRRALRAGEASLVDMLRERPKCLASYPIFALLAMGKQWGSIRVARLNDLAIDEGVNLAVPLGRAPVKTLIWLIDELEGQPRPEPRGPGGKQPPPKREELEPARELNYWNGGRWIDGPKLAEFLEPLVDEEFRDNNDALKRRIRTWKAGGVADLYRIEHHLIELGLHASDIPNDLWLVEGFNPRAEVCSRGHRVAGENAYKSPKGRVECLACKRWRAQVAWAQTKAAA